MNVTAVVPSLNPDEKFLRVVEGLVSAGFETILLVDDGSRPDCRIWFERAMKYPQCTLLRHGKNLGKGRALKTAMKQIEKDFGGKKLNGLSLSGKLLGQGWYRGSVQDGGVFYCFYREDPTVGMGAELRFSGSAVGFDDGDPVTVYDAVFYTGSINRGSYVYDKIPEENLVPLGQVPARYYSEILLHLTKATASATETDREWKKDRLDS